MIILEKVSDRNILTQPYTAVATAYMMPRLSFTAVGLHLHAVLS